jgi:hypothetical protein
LSEFVFKLNGQWFVGPRVYGGYGGAFAFLWPSRTPANSPTSSTTAPEFVPSSAGISSNFYEVGIEIFLRSNRGVRKGGPNGYDRLLRAQAEGRLISREQRSPELEVWRTQEKERLGPALWYVATKHVATDPSGAVLSCDANESKFDRCVTAFIRQPGIVADMRFRAKHSADWPAIYEETIRVLQQIKRA